MTALDTSGRPAVTVLQSFPRPQSTTNPYLVQLVRALPDDVRIEYFGWRRALAGRYDVLHLHWPEALLRSPSRITSLARTAAATLLLGVLRARRIAVVRTLHNPRPHEQPPPLDRVVLRGLDRTTTRWIRLNRFTVEPDPARTSTILHGHYRDWFGPPGGPPVPGRLLYFGLLRPYKGVESLLRAFAELRDRSVSLHIVGSPATRELRDSILAAACADTRVTTRLEYVDDPTLRDEIAAAELVVLPYRELHNSGAALLALSLDRPVLLPASEVTSALAEEVGPGWVHLYPGELTGNVLAAAAAATAAAGRSGDAAPAGRPDLSRREWAEAGAAHRAVYLAGVQDVGRRRQRRRRDGD
jgi:beta-1,4-mannosyltransferase